MAGRMIEFAGNGSKYSGYLAEPESGAGPGVIVIQEWWGLVGHIKDVVDRFAAAGFTALAPDFYHGKQTTEPDEAGSMMMALNIADAEKVVHGAVTALLAEESTSGEMVGVVGFCMGGQLSLFAACVDERIGACVDFYGIHPNVHPDYAKLNGPVLGFFASEDTYATPEVVAKMSADLTAAGKGHDFKIYEGRQHAFFNSDRPEVYDHEAAEECWTKMTAFFRENLA